MNPATPERYDIDMAITRTDMAYMKEKLKDIDNKLSNSYVTKDEFNVKIEPLQRIVYGMVGLILIAVFGAILGLVVLK